MISLGLELELQSYKGTYALTRTCFLYLLSNVVSSFQNSQLFARKLPSLAATYAPFDMELYNIHQTTETEKRAVKYSSMSRRNSLMQTVFENIKLGASRKGPRTKEIGTLHQDVTLTLLKYSTISRSMLQSRTRQLTSTRQIGYSRRLERLIPRRCESQKRLV